MGKFQDLTGQRFGRLTVIERTRNIGKYTAWLCRCDCGNKKIIKSKSLKDNSTKSCGCLQKEVARKYMSEKMRKYPDVHSRLKNIYFNMKSRCYNLNHCAYGNYGGRGITLCEEWKNNSNAFYFWAMNNGYQENLTIDRIDVNGNYEPSNCRWIDLKTQQRNRRNNHLITYNDETLCIGEWAEKSGIEMRILWQRLNKLSWSIEKALKTPIRKVNKNGTH